MKYLPSDSTDSNHSEAGRTAESPQAPPSYADGGPRKVFGILAVLGVLLWVASSIDNSGMTESIKPNVATVSFADTPVPSDVTESKPSVVQSTSRQPSMRRKLASTAKVVEGLATENFRLAVEGADELLHLSEEASWRVSRDAYYVHYSKDFSRTIRDLRDAAARRNGEEATFALNHAMVSCMACHRHVRGSIAVSQR